MYVRCNDFTSSLLLYHFLARLAGEICEKEITKEHIDIAAAKISGSYNAVLRTLAREEELVLKNIPASAGELYKKLKINFGMSRTSSFTMLKKLAKHKLLRAEIKGGRGRTTMYYPVKR